MLIDGFTVFAQAVNFLVLVLLLRYLLYGRVLEAVRVREARIAGQIEEAERVRAGAEADAEAYRERLRALEDTSERLLAEARQRAAATEQELTQRARADVRALETRWEAALRREQEATLSAIGDRLADHIVSIVGRILGDLTGRDLGDATADMFLRRVRETEPEVWERLAASLDREHPLMVRSARSLSENRKTAIRDLLASRLASDGREVEFVFETDPELILGVELRASGLKLGWSARGYLRRLDFEVGRGKEQETKDDVGEASSAPETRTRSADD